MTVDEALEYVAKHRDHRPAFTMDWDALKALHNEVLRMRDEPVYARMARVNGQLRDQLAHIETLPDKWDTEQRTSDVGLDGFDCAHELRTALATK